MPITEEEARKLGLKIHRFPMDANRATVHNLRMEGYAPTDSSADTEPPKEEFFQKGSHREVSCGRRVVPVGGAD